MQIAFYNVFIHKFWENIRIMLSIYILNLPDGTWNFKIEKK